MKSREEMNKQLGNCLPRKCARCGETIDPHDGHIWTMGQSVYCTKLCAVESMGMEHHCMLDDDYFDYFPKKSEDLFARCDGEVEK